MQNSNNLFGGVEFDLLDIEETRIKLGTEYCEAMAGIANSLVNTNKVRFAYLYGTHVCLIRT